MFKTMSFFLVCEENDLNHHKLISCLCLMLIVVVELNGFHEQISQELAKIVT